MSEHPLEAIIAEQQKQIDALKSEVARLRRQSDVRLGPRPDTDEEIKERAEMMASIIEKAMKDAPPVNRSKLYTTSGESVDKVRAEQTEATGQHKSYIVLCAEERARGFVRPYRDAYKHVGRSKLVGSGDFVVRIGGCGSVTKMSRALSETYARDPSFYGATFCVTCNKHLPVAEFVWTLDEQQVGS